jgi:gliding motility-associated-like protein
MPQPPFPPPYQPITWIDPPYNEMNMLNGIPGGVPLEIDPVTGLLTGLPNTIGQFVVGICVEEYRNGELISTTRRDFQYNVGECGQTLSSFFAPEFQCGDLSVSFQNLSQNADEYLWYFNDPGNPGATSSQTNPTYTFSDTGVYQIMLIAEPGTICADTFTQAITLLPNTLFPNFSFEIVECYDSLVVEVTDLSVDTFSTIVEWHWNLAGLQYSNEQNPVFVLDQSVNAQLTLTVTAANGCQQDTTLYVPAILIEETLPDTLKVCLGDSIPINPEYDPLLAFIWTPGATLSNPIAPNPFASPDSTTTYTAQVINFAGCSAELQVTVVVPEPIVLDLPGDTALCEPVVSLTALTNTGVEYYWATDPEINELIGLTPTIVVEPLGPVTYYVLVRDENGCSAQGEVTLTGNGVNLLTDSTAMVCLGDTLQVQVFPTDPDDQISYLWAPDSLVLSGETTSAPLILPLEAGEFQLYLYTNNQWDCPRTDSIHLMVVDTAHLEMGFAAQQCNGFNMQFSYTGPNASIVQWNFGDPVQPGSGGSGPNAAHTYPDTGWYTVTLTLPGEVPCPDTALFPIYVGNPGIQLDFGWNYPVCSDSVVIQFQNLSTTNQGIFTNQEWIFSTGQTSGSASPALTLFDSQVLEVWLIMESSDGCIDTLAQSLEVNLLNPALPDTVISCPGQSSPLNPDFNPDWTYQWSPPEGLSGVSEPNPLASPDQTTTYYVTITDVSGPDTCSVVRAVTALVPPPLDLWASADTVICESEVTLYAQSDAAISLIWSEQADFLETLGTGDSITLQPGRPGRYYVRAEDAFGCTLTDTILAGNYEAIVDAVPEYTICVGDSLQLWTQSWFPGDELDFWWEPASGILSGQGTGSPVVQPISAQTYTFFATNQYGCSDTGQVLVNVLDLIPPLQATAEPDTIAIGQSSQLTALSGSQNPDPDLQYSWSPAGTLDRPDQFDPIASPPETTQYEVTITTPEGCTNRELVLVVVVTPLCEDPYIFIPSAFSPNGDGKNDAFKVRGNFIDEVEVLVYDRWGKLVFESRDPEQGWDGTFKGVFLPPDVYGYYVRVRCFGGEQFIRKGNVTLIR